MPEAFGARGVRRAMRWKRVAFGEALAGARCAWRSMHLAREWRARRSARDALGARGVLARETLAAGGTWRAMCSAPDAFGARFAWRARHLARDALGEGEGEK